MDYSSESIFQRLSAKYPGWLRPELCDVQIVQTPEVVWLELTEERPVGPYLDMHIVRRDLGFCTGPAFDDTYYFDPMDPVAVNAAKFLEDWEPYSIVNTTELFTDEACEEIIHSKEYNPHLGC